MRVPQSQENVCAVKYHKYNKISPNIKKSSMSLFSKSHIYSLNCSLNYHYTISLKA